MPKISDFFNTDTISKIMRGVPESLKNTESCGIIYDKLTNILTLLDNIVDKDINNKDIRKNITKILAIFGISKIEFEINKHSLQLSKKDEEQMKFLVIELPYIIKTM